MEPLNLREFAENLIVSGQAEYGREILDLIDLEAQADIFKEIKEKLNGAASSGYSDKDIWMAVEFLSDRNAALTEIEKKLTEAGYKKTKKLDASDLVSDLLVELDAARERLEPGAADFDL